MNGFRLFNERKDIFGFEEIEARKEKEEKPKDDEQPVRAFNVQWMMDVLARKKINNSIRATDAFLDHVTWGERDGAIRVRLTPNIQVMIERRTTDLEGAKTWVLKRLFHPDIREFAGQEEIVANEIFEHVDDLHKEAIDSASEEYKNLITLTKRMSDRIRTHAPLIYDYQDIKEVDKNYYIIYFSIRNAGVGKLVSRAQRHTLSPEITIDVNYNKERGLVHIIVATVSYGGEGSGWEVDLPYLDAFFAPSQPKDEVIDTVLTAIKYY